MKLLLTGISCLFLVSSYALDIQIEGGNEVKVNTKEGLVMVRCSDSRGRRRHYSYQCYNSSLSSGNFGAIEVLNTNIDADFVKLQRVGSKYIKGVKYFSQHSRSERNLNLWIETLLQRPLLVFGENTLKYQFFKNNELVEKGEFNVHVDYGEQIHCGAGSILYSFCPTSFRACDDFFFRYCR